jgi:hypothetical protein
MPGNDFNRIIPGVEVEKFSEENYLDLQKRFVKVERILAENIRQWNAPSLLAMLTQTNYQMQHGTFTYASAGGSATGQVTLPKAWTTSHDVFLLSFRPLTSWTASFRVDGCGTSGLSAGTWHISGTTVQSYIATWISIGRSVL